jgi:hypothetical protein
MRNLIRAASVLSLVAVVSTGCDALKKKGAQDAGGEEAGAVAETVDAAPAAPAAPIAANVDDVARFPDEQKLDNVAGTTLRFASARVAPSLGVVVATLKPNTAVTKISQRTTFFLVTFDDPKGTGKKLLGWLTADAFLPPVDAGLKPIKCTAPEVALIADAPFCGQTCATDADCPGGKACKGAAQKFTDGKIGDNVQVCTVFNKPDAGAPAPVADAGAVAVVDAGAPVADAGGAPTGSADIIDPPANGPCPGGFFLVSKDKKCHRSCPTGLAPKDCKGGSGFCGKCDGAKVCTAVQFFCK